MRLQVVGIAVDYPAAVRKYAAARAIDYPVLVGEQGGLAAVSAFGMDTVLPFTVFADPAGRIVALKVGELHRDEAEFILDRLQDVEPGTPEPPGRPAGDLGRDRPPERRPGPGHAGRRSLDPVLTRSSKIATSSTRMPAN